MKYTNDQLKEAVKNNIFTQEQIDVFKTFVNNSNDQLSKLLKVLYYGGGFLIISAMTWLIGTSLVSLGKTGVVVFFSLYLIIFFISGYIFFYRKKLETAGGLLFSVSISLVPLLVFCILCLVDFWDAGIEYEDFYIWIKGRFIVLELCAIAFAVPILIKTKFPFILFLIAFALWFMSMDIEPIVFEKTKATWTERAVVSRIFGFIMIIIGYICDIKLKKDYSFWLYLFGLLTLISGFSVFYNNDNFMFIVFGIVHILMIVFSVILDRNVFLVFGSIGIIELLGWLSYKYFKGLFLFPFSLTVIGVILITCGVYYQKNRGRINGFIKTRVPKWILNIRPEKVR
ncbi:hypothetical protein FACS1894130_05820 [Spirochaetia bacterium]|nr:hypothetical protein FACS1894130_05820 [Spirochaetia bacterium]